jgi:hypothetical protein
MKNKTLKELQEIARNKNLSGWSQLRKNDLIKFLNKNLSLKQIYCGNNFAEVKPEQIIGNPYRCLQKGIGLGKSKPLEHEYYIPIRKNKYIPCKIESKTSPYRCLQKGFGVGQKILMKEKLHEKSLDELKKICQLMKFKNCSEKNKEELIQQILEHNKIQKIKL